MLQVTVKVKDNKEEDAAARKKYGVGKHKVDKMEHSIWELDELYRQIREQQAKVGREVRAAHLSFVSFGEGDCDNSASMAR